MPHNKLLGAHASDSLLMAESNLIVEGVSDERLLKAILMAESSRIKEALSSGYLNIIVAHGCSKAGPIVKLLKSAICKVHVVFDDDNDGQNATKHLLKSNVLFPSEVTLLKFAGMSSSEIEDSLDPACYWGRIATKYGITTNVEGELNAISPKWSDRLAKIFRNHGVQWGPDEEDDCKTIVADAIVQNAQPSLCIRPCRKAVLSALVTKLEDLLA